MVTSPRKGRRPFLSEGHFPQTENPSPMIPLLSISPAEHDHTVLKQMLDSSRWRIRESGSLPSALKVLREDQIPLVVCERDLHPGTWRDVLERLAILPSPPYLIVTSQQADDDLWIKALNAGAYDVLAKPLAASELIRTLTLAWQHWSEEFVVGSSLVRPKALAAAV